MKKTLDQRKLMTAVAVGMFVIGMNVHASKTDDSIESLARKSYVFTTYLKSDSIKISSEAGIVTLTGMVSRDTHKTMAERTMEGLPGVKIVHNRLKVKGETAAEKSDAWISARVISTLTFHRNVNGNTTKVVTKDGHVTLSGEASSSAQKDLTAEYAKDISGVKDVKNNMTVSKAWRKQENKTINEKVGETAGKIGDAAIDVKESVDDASITALVKMTLLYHKSTSALSTTVKTNDGIVTLGGKAKNAAEKDLATKLIGDVRGVKSIVNTMAI